MHLTTIEAITLISALLFWVFVFVIIVVKTVEMYTDFRDEIKLHAKVRESRERRAHDPPLQPFERDLCRGACGVLGCPNRRPHSHVEDLARRLKEEKERKK